MSHNVIVVGGGLAGLGAATYLARGGASVTLLEKAPDLGGRAITDTPGGFALDRGAHALYTGGAASDVLRELGVTYTSGSPRHIFGLDETGLHPFPSTALDLLRTALLSAGDKREFTSIFLRIPSLNSSECASESITSWIHRTATRPRVRRLLETMARVYVYNTALDVVSADVFVGRLQQTLKHPIHYIDGGWHTLVAGLHRAATAAGVKVSTSVSVAGVQLSDGLARGVRLHDGTELPCSQLVLALPPQDVLRLVADEPEIGAILPAHIACLDLALSRLPTPSHPVVLDLEQPRFMTAQSQFARLAPAHGAVVHVFKQLDARIGHDPIADRADMEALMDRVQPGWRDVVLENRFLPHMLGSGALPLAAQGGLAGRPSHRSRTAANVYFAGDWVGPEGYLADASLSSARASASSILRERVSAVRAA